MVAMVVVIVVMVMMMMLIGRAEEPMQDRRCVYHDGPPMRWRWEMTEGKGGPLVAPWKGDGNPYAPSCRNREEQRRASRLFRNPEGKWTGRETATVTDEASLGEEEACA